jgi:hypothetical protein
MTWASFAGASPQQGVNRCPLSRVPIGHDGLAQPPGGGAMSCALDPRSIAQALGGEAHGTQVNAPGPNHSRLDRSLSIRADPNAPDGFVVHSFAGDDPIACRDYVRRKLGLPEFKPSRGANDGGWRRMTAPKAKSYEAEPRQRTEDDLIRIARARELWEQGRDPLGTPAQEYLRSRALDLPNELAGSVLRYLPKTPWRNEDAGRTEFIPALLAAFRSIDDGEITAVHRIRLDQPERWPKAERRMLGLVYRAAVKLEAISNGALAVGEGVETCMAAQQLGLRPAWALGSVGGISFFPLLAGVQHLTILGESGKASEEAIKLCGRRWSAAGRRVRIAFSEIGSDVNDILIEGISR